MTLRDLLGRFSNLNILVAGDPMIDVYHFGRVERVSQEAPVPVFIEERVDKRLGGAANVWNQLAELGVAVQAGYSLDSTTWTEKHRYLVGSHQLFRVDFDRRVELKPLPTERPAPADAVVLSDYGKGALSEAWCQSYMHLGVPVIVDPKGTTWAKYAGATVICPNHLEVFDHLTYRWPAEHLIVKRGSAGLSLYSDGDPVGRDFPAQAKHVFDVTGAGDTVTALVAATVAAGGTLDQACELANMAAGFVVGEVGTTVCPLSVLQELAG